MQDGQHLTLVPFRPEDQSAVKELIVSGLEEHWGWRDLSRNPDLDDIARSYAGATFVVAWLDGRIVGTGALVPLGDERAQIVRMSVAADLLRARVTARPSRSLNAVTTHGSSQPLPERHDQDDVRENYEMLRNMLSVIAVLALALATLDADTPSARRVAITIDDGPVVGELSDLGNFQRITNGLVGAFQVERVPVIMFINERQLNVPGQRDARAAAVEQWLDAGFDLGNHTYLHRSANTAPLDEFLDDVVKGEVITRALLERRGRQLVWLRYPYLHSGTTAETHQAIVDFLDKHHYRVAPVTVDYADYAFAGPYGRALRRGDIEVAERIKRAYLDQVDVEFEYAERSSLELFGREIPHILLIHCNELNAVTLRKSIARMGKRGYTFITLDEAMEDPVYQRPDTFAGPGGSWLSRSATVMGKQLTAETSAARPVVPKWITDLRNLP